MAAKNPGANFEGWLGGVNSLIPPENIAPAQYAWANNCVNRGGIIQTRPGFRFRASLPGVKLQGSIIFTPLQSRPMMLVAVDGLIYAAKYPFTAFTKVDGLKFVETAQIINFQRCLKSSNLEPDGSIKLIPPKPIVIIQDGETRAGWYDGTTARHLKSESPFFEAPIGLWMTYTSSRLWIANGSRLYVSDLTNPDTFNEGSYIAEKASFDLPGDCTGLIETADQSSLLAFTASTTTAFKSNIRDRPSWQLTPEFQSVILPSIGCLAGHSPVNQYGITYWFSRSGFISLDAALYSLHTAQIVTIDGEMMRSKRVLSPDCSGVAATSFENMILVSVPAGGRYNEQTWVMDQTPQGQAGSAGQSAWVAIWSGVRPVVWMKTEFLGRERLFFSSFNTTAKNGTGIHIWEAFQDDRKDNKGRISCQWEMGLLKSAELQRFRYAEIELCEILGNVELKIYVGGTKGGWYLIKDTTLQAEVGSLGSVNQPTLTKTATIQTYKPQSRTIKTEEFSPQDKASNVETKDAPGVDKGFQLLFEWKGRMGIKAVRIVLEADPSNDGGECKDGEAGQHNIVTEQGETITV